MYSNIKQTLKRTQESTFLVTGIATAGRTYSQPLGTGFFVSPDGYFITAKHVVDHVIKPETITLERPNIYRLLSARRPKVVQSWEEFDLALLKVDIEDDNKSNLSHTGKSEYPYLEVDLSDQEEGELVYCFGYPLSDISEQFIDFGNKVETPDGKPLKSLVGIETIQPRVTSAIISSKYERVHAGKPESRYYIIDKELIHGLSGAPIVKVENGSVISVNKAIEYYTPPITSEDGRSFPQVVIYGITTRLSNIRQSLERCLAPK